MSELLPCPFHEEEQPARLFTVHQIDDDLWFARYGCDRCDAQAHGLGATKNDALAVARCAWNTRHERTCRPVWKKSKQQGRLTDICECSECGGCLDDLNVGIDGGVFPYCPYCGAKAVDE